MRVFSALLFPATVLVSFLQLSCVETEIPGHDMGSHRFEGILLENTCGPAAVPALEQIELDVQLRAEDSLAVWRPAGSPMLLGTVSESGDWRVRLATSVTLSPADPLTGSPGCTLDQLETIRFSLDESADPENGLQYTGTSTVFFAPSQGSVCTGALSIAGGAFYELPCEVEYELTSKAIDDLFPGEDDEDPAE